MGKPYNDLTPPRHPSGAHGVYLLDSSQVRPLLQATRLSPDATQFGTSGCQHQMFDRGCACSVPPTTQLEQTCCTTFPVQLLSTTTTLQPCNSLGFTISHALYADFLLPCMLSRCSFPHANSHSYMESMRDVYTLLACSDHLSACLCCSCVQVCRSLLLSSWEAHEQKLLLGRIDKRPGFDVCR